MTRRLRDLPWLRDRLDVWWSWDWTRWPWALGSRQRSIIAQLVGDVVDSDKAVWAADAERDRAREVAVRLDDRSGEAERILRAVVVVLGVHPGADPDGTRVAAHGLAREALGALASDDWEWWGDEGNEGAPE